MTPLQTIIPKNTTVLNTRFSFGGSTNVPCNRNILNHRHMNRSSTTLVSAVGDVSADSTIYLVAGAIGVALVGTAFPIIFSRKDT